MIENYGDVTGGGQIYNYTNRINANGVEITNDNTGNANQNLYKTTIVGGEIKLSEETQKTRVKINQNGIITAVDGDSIPDYTALLLGTKSNKNNISAWVGNVGGVNTICPVNNNGLSLGTPNNRYWASYIEDSIKIGNNGLVKFNSADGVLELSNSSGTSPLQIGAVGVVPKNNKGLVLGTTSQRFKEIWTGVDQRTHTGYTSLPNGYLLQWGQYYEDAPGVNDAWFKRRVWYNTTFPTNTLQVICMPMANSYDKGKVRFLSIDQGEGWNNQSFVLNYYLTATGNTSIYIKWVAIGY